MICNQNSLIEASPIKDMLRTKEKNHGVSNGMSEAGYDIRIKQDIKFIPRSVFNTKHIILVDNTTSYGRFVLASSMEEFTMPPNLVGTVHNKSTWARKGLSVFNTVIEPNWKGFLTLELVYFGSEELTIHAGSGIAQVIFHKTTDEAFYDGKYMNQENKPINAILD